MCNALLFKEAAFEIEVIMNKGVFTEHYYLPHHPSFTPKKKPKKKKRTTKQINDKIKNTRTKLQNRSKDKTLSTIKQQQAKKKRTQLESLLHTSNQPITETRGRSMGKSGFRQNCNLHAGMYTLCLN